MPTKTKSKSKSKSRLARREATPPTYIPRGTILVGESTLNILFMPCQRGSFEVLKSSRGGKCMRVAPSGKNTDMLDLVARWSIIHGWRIKDGGYHWRLHRPEVLIKMDTDDHIHFLESELNNAKHDETRAARIVSVTTTSTKRIQMLRRAACANAIGDLSIPRQFTVAETKVVCDALGIPYGEATMTHEQDGVRVGTASAIGHTAVTYLLLDVANPFPTKSYFTTQETRAVFVGHCARVLYKHFSDSLPTGLLDHLT
jgi:hypothetical protein